jgi:DNA-binding NarL/FixJ family response regulator
MKSRVVCRRRRLVRTVARLFRRRRTADPLDDRSQRATEVLGLVAEGLSNHVIAGRGTSPNGPRIDGDWTTR